MTRRASERAAFVAGGMWAHQAWATEIPTRLLRADESEAARRYPDDASPSPGEMAIEALRKILNYVAQASVGTRSYADMASFNDDWFDLVNAADRALAAADAEHTKEEA